MNSTLETSYPRVRIRGSLTNLSPLHIGDGMLDLFETRSNRKEHSEGSFNTLCVDHRNLPYLPASTLRGCLRHIANQHEQDKTKSLFGADSPDRPGRGRLYFFDATLQKNTTDTTHLANYDTQRKTTIRHGTAINPVTGTTDAHKLFRQELVPPGSRFECELILEDVNDEHVAFILHCLAQLDGSLSANLGKGSSYGQGIIQWETDRIDKITHDAIKTWLDGDTALETAYSNSNLEDIAPYQTDQTATTPVFHYKLIPDSPLLINDPGLVKEKKDKDDNQPVLEFSRNEKGQAVIPGSSIKGLLRGRARKIVLTKLARHNSDHKLIHEAGERANAILERLFGGTGQRGCLRFSNAIANESRQHLQYFNAVDRFTGGVADGKLYAANAAECDYLTGTILTNNEIPPTDKALLILLLRDAIDGDLQTGWGKARGYGRFHLEIKPDNTNLKNWDDVKEWLFKQYSENNIEEWFEQLEAEIQQLNQQLMKVTT